MIRRAIFVLAMVASGFGTAAATPQLQYVLDGSAGTVVFIHGKVDCSTAMTNCSSRAATIGPVAYWTNDYNNRNMLYEATTKYAWDGSAQTATSYEAFVIGYNGDSQPFWDAAVDVGACLQDLYQGTNGSGCNPSGYQRSYFRIVTHSAGSAVIDRLLSTGWYGVNEHIVGNVLSLAPAMAGSRAASALYGVDGYSNFCTSLSSWLIGWSHKNPGAQALTRSAVIGEANKGYAGRTPIQINKVTTTGGSGSGNNNWYVSVREHDNDFDMGILSSCMGYSRSDDLDGLIYWSDSDPTNDPSANGCPSDDKSCHYYAQFTGRYWHWFESWANHSHSRNDAYNTLGDTNYCDATGCYCYQRSPGTCIAQFGF